MEILILRLAMDDKFWSIFAMPIGVAMCFGPAMLVWWLFDRKKSHQDDKSDSGH